MESIVDVEGIYRDSTQKDISVKAERKVTLNITNPYENSEKAVILTQNVITNKILTINGQEPLFLPYLFTAVLVQFTAGVHLVMKLPHTLGNLVELNGLLV